jgi:hypothetical protein
VEVETLLQNFGGAVDPVLLPPTHAAMKLRHEWATRPAIDN